MVWKNKKGKIKRIWKLSIVILLILYFLPLLARVIPFGLSKKATADYFSNRGIKFSDSSVKYQGRDIHFVATGPDTGIMVLFVHGSPGTWADMKEYLSDTSLLTHYRLVAYDRPGYGLSGSKGVSSLQTQAECAAVILKMRKNPKPAIILGHSYGGPVSVKLCTMYPKDIGGLLLASPTVAPAVEENITFKRTLQNYSTFWLFEWMMDEKLLNSTLEMRPLPDEVRKMERDFSKITFPVIEIHGTRDHIAPFENQIYVCNKLNCTRVDTVVINEGNHFLIWNKRELVLSLLNKLLVQTH